LHVDKTIVLSSTLRLVRLHDLPGADLSEDLRLLVAPLFRHGDLSIRLVLNNPTLNGKH
jgi:hypothetical protein